MFSKDGTLKLIEEFVLDHPTTRDEYAIAALNGTMMRMGDLRALIGVPTFYQQRQQLAAEAAAQVREDEVVRKGRANAR